MSKEKLPQNSKDEKNNRISFFYSSMLIKKMKDMFVRKNSNEDIDDTSFTFIKFPYEILLMICSHLSAKDLLVSGTTCKTLWNVINDPLFKKRLDTFKSQKSLVELNNSKFWSNAPHVKCFLPNDNHSDSEILLKAYLKKTNFKNIEQISPTIGADFHSAFIFHNDNKIKMQFWDINYTERFWNLSDKLIDSSADFVIIIIRLNPSFWNTRELSLLEIQRWLDNLKKTITDSHLFSFIGHYDPTAVLQISHEDLIAFSENNNAPCYIVDRTKIEDVEKAFDTIAKHAAKHFYSRHNSMVLTKEKNDLNKNKSTCLLM